MTTKSHGFKETFPKVVATMNAPAGSSKATVLDTSPVSKREQFALAIFCAMLADSGEAVLVRDLSGACYRACSMADALLKALRLDKVVQ